MSAKRADGLDELGHVSPPDREDAPLQPLQADERELVDKGYALFDVFRREGKDIRNRAALCRRIYLLDDPELSGVQTGERAPTPQLHTLKSTVVSCVADQMDNMPEAVLMPERADLKDIAEDLTDMVRYVMSRNDFEEAQRQRVTDYFVAGCHVMQVVWDEDMGQGQGEVALIRVPVEAFYWDPCADEVQEGRAIFKASFHPVSWYEQHYPEAAPYIQQDRYIDQERSIYEPPVTRMGDEGEVLLLEYWYRKYDASTRRTSVHVAYLAGGALLYSSEREAPRGIYEHGKYPFVVDVFTKIDGMPVGNGMVWEFAPMQRYVNRYARYIDENIRMAAKARLLVNRGAGIDEEALEDWSRNIIQGDNVSEQGLRWFQSQPLPGQAGALMASFQDQIKMDSGQNQFTRGEAGMGVTAASAIAALQEAGGKTSRLSTAVLNTGFRQMVELIIWLIAQYYDKPRERLIIGRDGRERTVSLDGRKVKGRDLAPPYQVQVQIQRRNPMRQQAQNELILQIGQIAAQAGQQISPAQLVDAMLIDGKDRIMPLLREADNTQQVMEGIAQQAQQAIAERDQAIEAAKQMEQQLANMQRMLAAQRTALATRSSTDTAMASDAPVVAG